MSDHRNIDDSELAGVSGAGSGMSNVDDGGPGDGPSLDEKPSGGGGGGGSGGGVGGEDGGLVGEGGGSGGSSNVSG